LSTQYLKWSSNNAKNAAFKTWPQGALIFNAKAQNREENKEGKSLAQPIKKLSSSRLRAFAPLR